MSCSAHMRAHAHARTECCMSVMLKHLQLYIAEGGVFLHCIVPADEMWCHRKPADDAVEICHLTKGVEI